MKRTLSLIVGVAIVLSAHASFAKAKCAAGDKTPLGGWLNPTAGAQPAQTKTVRVRQ